MNQSLQAGVTLRSPDSNSELLVKVDGVSKRFCRDLKRSLWYGVQDIASEWLPWRAGRDAAGQSVLRADEFWAVKDVSFELRRGECLGLIGRNGAGKTTLLKMLNGLFKPDQGRIEIRGRVGAVIALGAGFNPILTGRENIYVNGAVLGLGKKEIDARFDEIVDFAELAEFIDTPVQNYSSGMQVRLGFAVAATLEPDVLILDEVLAVGDAAFRVKSFNRIQDILKKTAVIFVSHNLPQITRICSRILVLERGSAIMDESDLGKAILLYRKTIAAPERKTVLGSGKLVIYSVELHDENGKEMETLAHGARFSITVGATTRHAGPIPDPRIMLVFADEEGNHVAEVFEPIQLAPNVTSFHVNMSFAEAPFNSGRFYISAALMSGDAGGLDSVLHNVATFLVERDICGYAPMTLRPETLGIS